MPTGGGTGFRQPSGSTPEEFTKHIVAETAKWGPVVEKSGAKVE